MPTGQTIPVAAVNACGDDRNDEGAVIVMLRPEGEIIWKWFRLNEREAVQLADQLRLLTRTTD